MKHKREIQRYAALPDELQSDYLRRGFANEHLTIRDVEFDFTQRTANGRVYVETDFQNDYANSAENSWHWSFLTTSRAVSQLAVAYICSILQTPKRQLGEVIGFRESMSLSKPVLDKKNVPISLKFPRYILRPTKLVGQLYFDIAEGSFVGNMEFKVNLGGRDETS